MTEDSVPARRGRKPRRATVLPTRLNQVAPMHHTFERPEQSTSAVQPHADDSAEMAPLPVALPTSADTSTGPANVPSRSARGPVLPTRAREDTDEGWGGQSRDDLGDWLKSERPPHWGKD